MTKRGPRRKRLPPSTCPRFYLNLETLLKMRIVMEPTPELYDMEANGTVLPVRIWRGVTEGGVQVECLVASIIPQDEEGVEGIKKELPDYMVPSREMFKLPPH